MKIHVKLKCALCNICHEADRNLLSSRAYDLPERRQRVILTKRRKKKWMGVLERFQRQSMCGNSIGDGEERIQAFQSADSIVNYTDSICRPLCVLQQPDWSPGVQSHSPLPHSRRTTCTPSQPPRTCSDPTFSSGPMPNPGHPLLKQPRLDSLDGLKRGVSAATVIGWVQRTRK